MSGSPGHGGTVDFNTYFVGSGTGHGAGGTALLMQSGPVSFITLARPQPHLGFFMPQSGHFGLQAHCGFGFSHTLHGQPHLRFGFWQTLQEPPLAKPSCVGLAFAK